MSLLSLLHRCSHWAPIVFIRENDYGMPAVQSVHLMGLTVLLATILVLDLRLAGVGMKGLSLTYLARQLKPWMMGAVTLMILTGTLMFLVNPDKYLASTPFRVKMTLLCLAMLFHFAVVRRFTASESGLRPRLVTVIVACLSLILWFGVGWAGRAIAFVP